MDFELHLSLTTSLEVITYHIFKHIAYGNENYIKRH